mmetsp:Transcript_5201/g.20969  ORF Transcript_5201/g.20969 Transcript_5201/m.20969 type:complete len:267 (+) Transcript_5201:2062-2862(+)
MRRNRRSGSSSKITPRASGERRHVTSYGVVYVSFSLSPCRRVFAWYYKIRKIERMDGVSPRARGGFCRGVALPPEVRRARVRPRAPVPVVPRRPAFVIHGVPRGQELLVEAHLHPRDLRAELVLELLLHLQPWSFRLGVERHLQRLLGVAVHRRGEDGDPDHLHAVHPQQLKVLRDDGREREYVHERPKLPPRADGVPPGGLDLILHPRRRHTLQRHDARGVRAVQEQTPRGLVREHLQRRGPPLVVKGQVLLRPQEPVVTQRAVD